MQSPEVLTDLFRANGRKVTAQRRCIFRALRDDATHPSAERVHQTVRAEMPSVSLRTVYQTLNDLADLGAIATLDVGTGATRFDPNVEVPHHHLVCRGCGTVRDVVAPASLLATDGHEASGFHLESAEVVFRGLCDACWAGGGAPGGESDS